MTPEQLFDAATKAISQSDCLISPTYPVIVLKRARKPKQKIGNRIKVAPKVFGNVLAVEQEHVVFSVPVLSVLSHLVRIGHLTIEKAEFTPKST